MAKPPRWLAYNSLSVRCFWSALNNRFVWMRRCMTIWSMWRRGSGHISLQGRAWPTTSATIGKSKKLTASPLITKEIAGVGLGLHIVSRLVHAHGTDFTSDRETGASTTVTNRFPKERILMPA